MLSPGNLGLRFLGAIQFLTTIPISRSTVPPHEAAPFFPLIGAGIGALSALPLAFLPLPAPLSAALTLSLQLILTGMLHEDGLADISDGVRKGRAPERMFEIIKDPRIGSYGACTLILALLFRWQALSLIPPSPFVAVPTIAATESLSRCAILWLGFLARPARPGMGAWLSESHSPFTLLSSLLFAAGWALWAGPLPGLSLLLGLFLLALAASLYFHARLGGVVGDCFGALQQITVIYCLLVFLWP